MKQWRKHINTIETTHFYALARSRFSRFQASRPSPSTSFVVRYLRLLLSSCRFPRGKAWSERDSYCWSGLDVRLITFPLVKAYGVYMSLFVHVTMWQPAVSAFTGSFGHVKAYQKSLNILEHVLLVQKCTILYCCICGRAPGYHEGKKEETAAFPSRHILGHEAEKNGHSCDSCVSTVLEPCTEGQLVSVTDIGRNTKTRGLDRP